MRDLEWAKCFCTFISMAIAICSCSNPVVNEDEPVEYPDLYIHATSLSLNKSNITLTQGETETLTATIQPSDATDKTVVWVSSDPSKVAINNGLVSALSEGTAIITASTDTGKITANCSVTVLKLASNNLTIPDPAFKAFLVSAFDSNHDGEISPEEAETVTEIHCNGLNINSLEGIENFKQLKSLDCANNNLTELDVSTLTKLEEISCRNCNISLLSFANNSALHYIDCSNNKLTSLNVSSNAILSVLLCNNNLLTGVLDISKTDEISTFDCTGNQIQTIYVSVAVKSRLDAGLIKTFNNGDAEIEVK